MQQQAANFCVFTAQGNVQCVSENFAAPTVPVGNQSAAYLDQIFAQRMQASHQSVASKPIVVKKPVWKRPLPRDMRLSARRVDHFAQRNKTTGATKVSKTPKDPNSKDCRLSSEYTDWSQCIDADPTNCNGVQYQTQKIAAANVGDGKPCPSLNVRTRRCDTDPTKCHACDPSARQYQTLYGSEMRSSQHANDAWAHYNNVGRMANHSWQKCQ